MAVSFPSETRPPAAAGRCYPASRLELASMLDHAVSRATIHDLAWPVDALVVPHAQDDRSIGLLVDALESVRRTGRTYRRVVITGPAHDVPLPGLSLPTHRWWETPLDTARVDTDAVGDLLGVAEIALDDRAHREEWSIETVLVGVQRVFGDVAVVPLVVGIASAGAVAGALDLLAADETLTLVSTEMGRHGRAVDTEGADALAVAGLARLRPPGRGEACAVHALAGLCELARRRGWSTQLLDRALSAGEPVTGYATMALGRPPG